MAAAWFAGGCARDPGLLGRDPVAYEARAWKFGRHAGQKLITEHYVIYTTLQDEVLLEALPDFMEGAYTYYARITPPVREPEKRMRVFLFASRGQWEAFTRKFTGERAPLFLKVRNGGYSERGISVIEYVAHSVTFPLFAHEGWHQYLHHHAQPNIPAWINEGLAVCCEGQRWGSYKGRYGLVTFDPAYNPVRRNALAEALLRNDLHPLRKLLRTNPGRIIGGSSRSVATYYAQVWALMLFLEEGEDGKYADRFRQLLDKLGDPELRQHARAAHISSSDRRMNLGMALFHAFITEDLDTFEREYVEYMKTRFLGPA
jgi:hypothetical protein